MAVGGRVIFSQIRFGLDDDSADPTIARASNHGAAEQVARDDIGKARIEGSA